jgi:hypothetical protein
LLCVFNSSASWHMATIVHVIVGSVINYVNARSEMTCRLLRPWGKIRATPPIYFLSECQWSFIDSRDSHIRHCANLSFVFQACVISSKDP